MGGEVSDSLPRLLACVRALTGDKSMWGAEEEAKLWLKDVMVLEASQLAMSDDVEEEDIKLAPEQCIMLRQIGRDRKGLEAKLEDDGDLTAAMGGGGQDDGALFADRLAKSSSSVEP